MHGNDMLLEQLAKKRGGYPRENRGEPRSATQ